MYKRKNLLLALSLAFILLINTACTSDSESDSPTTTPVATLNPEMNKDSIKVGVLAIRSAVAANSQYGPFIAYLQEELEQPFELVPLEQESQFVEVEQNNVDFVLSNPLASVQLRRLYDTEFLLTLSRVNTGTQFGGIIIVSAESDIETVDDLYGKDAACVAFETAAAGCIFQIYHLQQQGFDPFADFLSFSEIGSQDNIVLGVLNGTYDVGFVRTGQLERMANDETILAVDELRIIDLAEDDFHFPHTTILYPEWPLAALANTDPELKEAVTTALLTMPSDHPSLENAGVTEFVPAVDYSSIDALIESLQLRSWDAE